MYCSEFFTLYLNTNPYISGTCVHVTCTLDESIIFTSTLLGAAVGSAYEMVITEYMLPIGQGHGRPLCAKEWAFDIDGHQIKSKGVEATASMAFL